MKATSEPVRILVADDHRLFAEALTASRTVVVDCRVDPAEQCFPMVPTGAAAVDMIEFEPSVEEEAKAS